MNAPVKPLALVVISILVLSVYVYKKAYPRPYRGIPYNDAAAKQLWGDTPAMLDEIKTTQDPARFIFKQNRILDSPVAQLFLRPFAKSTVIIDDVREVRDILSNRTHEFDRAPRTQDAYRALLPHSSLVKLTGPAFKEQRRFWEGVTGTLFLRRVAEPKMYQTALELIDLLKAQADLADGRPFPCFDDFDVAAFDVIWTIVFGTNVNAMKAARNDVLKAVQTAGGAVQPPSRDSLAVIPPVPRPAMCETVSFFISTVAKSLTSFSVAGKLWYLRQQRDHKERMAIKNDTINGIIEKTYTELSKISLDELEKLEETSSVVTGVRRHLLALLRQGQPVGTRISPKVRHEIHDELFMLLVAGHETKAVLLSWSVKFLIAHPEEQDNLRQALSAGLSAQYTDGQPSLKAILTTSMPYLDAFMEESIRVANVSPRLVRVATTDTQVLGYPIQKGATILLNPYVGTQPLDLPENSRSETSRNAKANADSYWDPNGMDDFVPKRWLTKDGAFDPRKFPRLGFSAGPRQCYGRGLAMLEFRISLVLLVLNFDFKPLPPGLDSMETQQRLFRMPRQCYVRLSAR